MSNDIDDFDNDEDDDENEGGSNSRYEEVDLKYAIYNDVPNMSVYLKFSGFNKESELDDFADYIESYLPLILFASDTKH